MSTDLGDIHTYIGVYIMYYSCVLQHRWLHSTKMREYYNTVYNILSFPLNIYSLITSSISICIEMHRVVCQNTLLVDVLVSNISLFHINLQRIVLWHTLTGIWLCLLTTTMNLGFPRWLSGKESACKCRRLKTCRFDPWVGKILWNRKWQPEPVFLPGKIPWTEEPGRLHSMGFQRVERNWAHWAHNAFIWRYAPLTHTHTHTHTSPI